MKLTFLSAFVLILSSFTYAQETAKIEEIKISPFVEGTLLLPRSTEEAPPLVILLQGSGPTDRNGNQSFMKNDSFKKLAQGLADNGIANFRYDKRILRMQSLNITEEEIRFDDFITDAVSVIEYFTNDDRFSNLIVLGHSQGSLVGMVAAKDKADAFISIAGTGKSIDSIIVDQIEQQMPGLKDNVQNAFLEMRTNGSTSSYNPVLESVFRPSVQPFMLSWMKYEPIEQLKALNIPMLIINGTQDLQVSEQEARNLHEAKPDSELVIIENLNHVLREIKGDDLENSKSYNEPGRPLHPELVPTLVEFIKGIE